MKAFDVNALLVKAFDVKAFEVKAFAVDASDVNAFEVKAFEVKALATSAAANSALSFVRVAVSLVRAAYAALTSLKMKTSSSEERPVRWTFTFAPGWTVNLYQRARPGVSMKPLTGAPLAVVELMSVA